MRADAPQPVRIARAAPPVEDAGPLAGWVSPLTGQALAAEAQEAVSESTRRATAKGAVTLAERLAAAGPGPGAVTSGSLGEAAQ